MLIKHPLRTSRLLIRSFHPKDADDLYDYLSDERVYRFEPGEPIDEDKARFLAADMEISAAFWAVELAAERKVIGQIYFNQNEPAHLMTWELGYILSPQYQNQGFMSEAAAALVKFGFGTGKIHRVVAHCNPENPASWKLLEKIGFRREGWHRKDNFFRRDSSGTPIWTDTFVYARLAEDEEPSLK